jgi:hypothetical protein
VKTEYPFVEGQRVRALRQVTEQGGDTPGEPNARVFRQNDRVYIPPSYIHAEAGDFGVVRGVDDGIPTVFFDTKGTGTNVGKHEVKAVDFKVEDFMKGFLCWWHEIDNDAILDEFDLALGWFSAKGCSHDEALRAAEIVQEIRRKDRCR